MIYRITYEAQGHTRKYRAVTGEFKTRKDAESVMKKLSLPNSRVEKFWLKCWEELAGISAPQKVAQWS